MRNDVASTAWALYVFNWYAIGIVGVLLLAVIYLTEFELALNSVFIGGGFVAVYGAFAWYNAARRHRQDPQVVFVLGGFSQIVLVTLIMTPLTYLAAAVNWPMQDETLKRIDQALGLDWVAYLSLVSAYPVLAIWIDFAYTMIKWPLFIVPVALAACRRYDRIQHFVLAFLLGLIVTAAISVFVPALGAYHAFDLSIRDFPLFGRHAYEGQLIDLPRVRDGSLRMLDLGALNGVVTFPSFHAASAVIYLWALWPAGFMRHVAIVTNGAMLAATPIVGGHYFIDIIGGVAVAIAAIAAAGVICRRVAMQAAPAPECDGEPIATPRLGAARVSNIASLGTVSRLR